jgi:hypothetical protein
VKALSWTAVINGLLARFLLVAILVVAADKKLMQGEPSSRLGWAVVAITTVAMFAGGVAMFVVQAADFAVVEPHACPGLAKLIVRSVQFGSAGPFFPAYAVLTSR